MYRRTDWLIAILAGATLGVLLLAWSIAIFYACYGLATWPLNDLVGWALTCGLGWQAVRLMRGR